MPDPMQSQPGAGTGWIGDGIVWAMGQAGDGMIPWGTNPTERDKQLRAFLPTESILNSAIGSVVVRNAGMSWKVNGSERLAAMGQDLLTNANMGRGWLDFAARLSMSLYSQDKGAFVEIIRGSNSPNAPVLGIQTLDSVRCWRTDDPEIPVIYQDLGGRYHSMMWYQVAHLLELPSTYERLSAIQYSAITRVLRACQIWKSIATYTEEKVSGRHTKAIHIVGGTAPGPLKAAIEGQRAAADAQGLTRYIQPVVLTTATVEAEPKLVTVELATLPDGWDPEKQLKEYLTILSMGLFTDYQELAPLPGGNLGTGAQSEMLHLKSRGKGPQIYRKLIEQLVNHEGILPVGCEFEWDDVDYEEDAASAQLLSTYSEAIERMVDAGVIDEQGGRQMLMAKDLLSPEEFARMDGLTRPEPTLPAAPSRPRGGRTDGGDATVTQESRDFEGDKPGLERRMARAMRPEFDEAMADIWRRARA